MKGAKLITIPSTDEHKNIATLSMVWEMLSEQEGTRRSCLINLGGGMVTDLGGFAAATFKRGISFINIPTTLLAMVDAAVGGVRASGRARVADLDGGGQGTARQDQQVAHVLQGDAVDGGDHRVRVGDAVDVDHAECGRAPLAAPALPVQGPYAHVDGRIVVDQRPGDGRGRGNHLAQYGVIVHGASLAGRGRRRHPPPSRERVPAPVAEVPLTRSKIVLSTGAK